MHIASTTLSTLLLPALSKWVRFGVIVVVVVIVGEIVVDEDGVDGDGVVITVVLSNGVAWLQGSVGHL